MKKVCLLLVMLMVFSCFAGCGEKVEGVKPDEVMDFRISLGELEKVLAYDEEKFVVSGTTATLVPAEYDRTVTADIADGDKVVSIKIEFVNLETESLKSSAKLIAVFEKESDKRTINEIIALGPVMDLIDVMTLVGAEESEVTNSELANIVANNTSFSKNDWTIKVSVGNDSVSIVANHISYIDG